MRILLGNGLYRESRQVCHDELHCVSSWQLGSIFILTVSITR